jgi:hypothetical protein
LAEVDPLKVQVGGDHYKLYPIQPAEYNIRNDIPWAEGDVISYVTRWREKGGIADLQKAIHILQMLIRFERERLDLGDGEGDYMRVRGLEPDKT